MQIPIGTSLGAEYMTWQECVLRYTKVYIGKINVLVIQPR